MLTFDVLLLVMSSFQPIIIGHVAFMGIGRIVSVEDFFLSNSDVRSVSLNSRVYECATYSKLSNLFSYNINTTLLMLTFLIYDIDFIFFLQRRQYY